MKRQSSQQKNQVNVENFTIQNNLSIDNLGVEVGKSNLEMNRTSSKDKPQESSEDIYEKKFNGKIYTFYSLNLRHLFTSKIEERLDKRLRNRLKDKKKNYEKWLNSSDRTDYDKNKKKIARIIEKLLKLRRNANKFLASREYNYFAKNVEIVSSDTKANRKLLNKFIIQNRNRKKGAIVKKLNNYNSKLKPFLVYENDDKQQFYVVENNTEVLKRELNNGISLSVFRHNLTEDWLGGNYFKVFQIDEDKLKKGEIKEKETVPVYYIRLSKLGVLEIRKEEIYSSNSTLKDSMKPLVGYEDRNSFKDNVIAEITYSFCKFIEPRIQKAFKLFNNDATAVTAKTKEQLFEKNNEYSNIPSLTRLDRQRYIVIVINDIECFSNDKEHKYVSEQALTILEGRFLKKDENDFIVPRVVSKINNPKDVSTWDDELCFFSAERSLIYFKKEKGEYPNGISYEEYWDCIIRGIEFSCLIRMALRIIESTSRKLVHHIPARLIDFDDNDFNEVKAKIRQLEIELAHFLEIVPEVRSACNAINSFRSERNVKKFNVLQDECFGFEEILKGIQKNIDELTYFVNTFKQRVLQKTIDNQNEVETKEDKKLNIIALLFTIVTVIYVFPSFVHDFAEWKWVEQGINYSLTPNAEFWLVLIYIGILVVISLSCYVLYMLPECLYSRFLKAPFRKETFEYFFCKDTKGLTEKFKYFFSRNYNRNK